jgi:hypothetical protein
MRRATLSDPPRFALAEQAKGRITLKADTGAVAHIFVLEDDIVRLFVHSRIMAAGQNQLINTQATQFRQVTHPVLIVHDAPQSLNEGKACRWPGEPCRRKCLLVQQASSAWIFSSP